MNKCPVCQSEYAEGTVICGKCDKEVLSNEANAEMSWYYAEYGKSVGPVSANDLQEMYESEILSLSSRVWKAGMQDWVELRQTNIIDRGNTPPPLAGNDINNTYAWAIAIVPIVLGFITNRITNELSIVGFAISLVTIVLWILDKAALKKAGYKTSGWMFTILLVTPLYLFLRAKRTGKEYGYAICWCILFVFNVLITVAIDFSSL